MTRSLAVSSNTAPQNLVKTCSRDNVIKFYDECTLNIYRQHKLHKGKKVYPMPPSGTPWPDFAIRFFIGSITATCKKLTKLALKWYPHEIWRMWNISTFQFSRDNLPFINKWNNQTYSSFWSFFKDMSTKTKTNTSLKWWNED